MTDIEDTRDIPGRRRAGFDAHTDWQQKRMSSIHREWLSSNGKLMMSHFSSAWPIYSSDSDMPDTTTLESIINSYNAKMLEIAGSRNAPTYKKFLTELKSYEKTLLEQQTQLQQGQIDTTQSIIESFRQKWLTLHFKKAQDISKAKAQR